MATRKSKKPMSPEEKDMLESAIEAAHHGLLDEPGHHDKPSATRHTVYIVAVLTFGAVINILALMIVAR